MDRATFDDYVATYNAADWDGLSRFYADDVLFENFGGHRVGPEAIAFLREIHQGITDNLIPLTIVSDGDDIAMECDDDITALTDLPDLPAGAMVKGDHVVVRTFVLYRTRGDEFTHIRIAGWPPRRVP